MGRLKSITPPVCAHRHFTNEERLQLEFYLSGTGKLPKITNLTMSGTLLHKHPRTIRREIDRGQVEHLYDEGLQRRLVYNADYAESLARARDSGKGPELKLGMDYTLAKEIGKLMKERHYSPYAVIATFNDKGWPMETRICEKTLYSYVHEGLIPEVTERDLLLKGKGRRTRIFFAHPYCASERGTNERHNGIFRWFIPKGSAIGDHSKAETREIQDWMNNYPRRILNGRTPAQMIREEFPDRIMILRFFNIIPKEAA